jgi:RHS repeat-associated protein
VHYYFSDRLGTHSLITDANGDVPPQQESDYYPYGGEIPISGNDSNHYKFTAKERDSESNLDYFGARHYASATGRFMTPDWSEVPYPVPYANFQNPQALNLYGYVQNNPIFLKDATGHVHCDPDTGTWGLNGVTVTAGACHLDWWDYPLAYVAIWSWVQHKNEQLAEEALTNGVALLASAVDCGCDQNDDQENGDKKSSSNEKKPKRVSNPKHHPNSASPEPKNVQELFDKSIADGSGVRWAKDSDGTIHRFSAPSNGESHWNGSTAGADPIRQDDIPNDVRRALK